MGGQSNKSKLSKHRSSDSKLSGHSSSSGKASSSAPRSAHSQHDVSPFDGPNSPSSPLKSPKSPSSPKSPREKPASSHDVTIAKSRTVPKNLDLGASQFSVIYNLDKMEGLPKRPKAPSRLGVETQVALNTFNVASYPQNAVHQYEVMIGNGVEKRGIVQKVWQSGPVKRAMGGQVIFDGDRLAWCMRRIDQEIRLLVDLDRESGRTPRPGKSDQHRVVIRHTNKVRFDVLEEFLAGKGSFDNRCLEAINCLDHILREHPSSRLVAIKRAFYPRNGERFDLGGGLEVVKGVYQSLRPVLSPRGPCLSINVDVSNGTFFKALPLIDLMIQMTGKKDIPDLLRGFQVQGGRGKMSQDIKRLQKRRVIASHRKSKDGRQAERDEYVINKFIFDGAKKAMFEQTDRQTGKTSKISVFDYFLKQYGKRLNYPDLPLVQAANKSKALLPIEILAMAPNQVCKFKLDERQTSNMIKFAVTPPKDRWAAVQQGLRTLNWQADPVMQTFGLGVSNERTVVPGRVLAAPRVVFGGNGSANPGTTGRWDLKGKKFLESNSTPLKSWGVMVVCSSRGGKPDKSVVENFISKFVQGYIDHGGKVENKQPVMLLSTGMDVGSWVTTVWNNVGAKHNQRPQIILFILPDKNTEVYMRIKRSMDCRFGAVSQCVQYSHVQKAQAQYISNVLMKFNAKLGGVTCRAVGPRSGGPTGLFDKPTVVVGADVSHAAPGSAAASVAAITCSMDRLGLRYAAAVDSNGYRVEMITEANIKTHLKPMLQQWCQAANNGKLPQRVIYLRDGVSEGQFQHVLEQEVHYMKQIFKDVAPGQKIDFVVIIAQKRHQIRFFPKDGDRNGNALPGTLVENGATHPFENDFYLCAHAAIKGTARPVHYQVILNEPEMPNDEIYTLLYEHSYQYLRATTPVSIHPAVYYAHIASNRGVCHDKHYGSMPDSSSDDKSSNTPGAVSEPMMVMPNEGGIRNVPWFI